MSAVYVVEVDHRVALVSFTLAASLHTSLATNAAIGIDEELVLIRNGHQFGLLVFSFSVFSLQSSIFGLRSSVSSLLSPVFQSLSARRTLTAHTLYSGIFEIGSCAAIVS